MGYAAVAGTLQGGGVVVLDGAMGSEVLRRTGQWVRNGIESAPEVIEAIHREYLEAGADVITANTFQIARHTFLSFFQGPDHMRAIGLPGLEHRAEELARRAVALALRAREAAGAADRVAVAGSVSPLNHPYRSDLAPGPEEATRAHADTVRVLREAGVDLILLETMNTLAEARAALEAAKETGLPVWVSLVPNGRGETLGGDPLAQVAEALAELGPDAILVNCAPAEHIGRAVEVLAAASRVPVGAYALVGRYAPPSWKMDFYPRFVDTDATPPERYARHATAWMEAGARILGGCCGTGPDHIRRLAAAVRAGPAGTGATGP